MIESGTAGTAARVHAAALRADGAPEASEWFLRVAEHQEATGRRLSALSPAWAILHEVVPTGVDGLIDHVVIGPGGAYIVVTRPCDGELSLENQSLVCAGVSLDHDLEQVRRAAVALTSQLGTPVVPVLALAVKALPFGAPLLSGGVMVCTVDRLVNTITKATHTDLAADRVVELVEAAAPLLRDPSSVVRPDRRAQSRGERTSASRLPSMEKADPPMSSTTGAPQRRRRFTVVNAALALAAAAVIAGIVVRFVDPAPAAVARSVTTTSGPLVSATQVSVLPPLAAHLSPPSVGFATSCPASGRGWTLTPTWPGSVPDLAEYVLEVRSLDGSWRRQGAFASPSEMVGASLVGQQAGQLLAARITAVLIDGSTSPNSPTLVQVPKADC